MGGISHVKIPINDESTEPTWTSIYDPKEIESLVLQQHQKHFSQAAGTTFTITPLCTLINDNCTSEYAQQILAGTANINALPVDEYTKNLLTHLKTKVLLSEQPQLPLDQKHLSKASKSGQKGPLPPHPGDTLGSKIPCKTLSTTQRQIRRQPLPHTPSPLQSGNDVLKLIIMMMDIAVTHTHTYDWWKTIWTLLLKKDPGDSKIDRLCTIHLYEADYNLLLKWFSSKGFILHSKKAHCITDSQGGGHPGHSVIDLTITKVLSYEVADILHLQVIIIDNDTTACFDCMIEAQNNLACLQHGTNPQYIKLHAQTQQEL